MNAFSVMTSAKIAASTKASGRALAFYMNLSGLSGVPITEDDGAIVGIVSEQDIIRALFQGKKLDAITASDLMTRDVITVTFDTSLDEILGIFASRHVLNLPVVQNGKLVGMVTRGEALRAAEHAHLMTIVA